MINLILFAFVLGVSPFLYGEQCGMTTHDLQSWGNSGNRVVSDTDGNAHICWT